MAASPGLGCGDVQQVGWCLQEGLGVVHREGKAMHSPWGGRRLLEDAQPMGREADALLPACSGRLMQHRSHEVPTIRDASPLKHGGKIKKKKEEEKKK